ncbi:MAG TPA: GNAT family N-acetyltransferase [Acidimicrobiia bacterium]|nr:GNAT family N-acetyltransferase [Acidimicrobiia bacterium]
MQARVVPADTTHVTDLVRLYRGLEGELTALKPIWRLSDGLPEPVEVSLAEIVEDKAWQSYVASIDEVIVGFLLARDEELLPQADGRRVGSLRFIYTDADVREVGVGEAMIERYLADARSRGITLFDAHVSPGHRLSKNFFEAHGFKARSIVMHREES